MAKSNKGPLYGLLIFFVVSGGFAWLLTLGDDPIPEIENAKTIEKVKQIWDKYPDFWDEPGFSSTICNKLADFNPSEAEIEQVYTWLPKLPKSINLIVVPDLSRRINQIPNQVEDDKKILKEIGNIFKQIVIRGARKSRLLVTITDGQQAKGRFGEVSDNCNMIYQLVHLPDGISLPRESIVSTLP